MGLFSKTKKGGFRDVIRCDEPSYLIWKWHPSGTKIGESKRENTIRTSSTLRVKDGEVAVFVYKQKDGTKQDYIEGPFDAKLKTGNFPVLSSIIGLFYEGDSPFQAEVYFINLSKVIQVKFGVPYFDVYDPTYQGRYGVPVAVRGTISFNISDYKEFIKYNRLINFTLDDFKNEIRDAVKKYIKSAVTNAPFENNIPVVHLERKIVEINKIVDSYIKPRLCNDFGVTLKEVDISAIEIDKSSSDYAELLRITKDITSETVLRQTNANLENYEESLRIQREEAQYAMHMQTNTANLGAYQVEKQADVGVATANALGKMGENGAGNVNLGNNSGFNPMAMMAGMALGNVAGQNLGSTLNNAMNPTNNTVTPPPIPKETYYVAVDGKPTGPYDIETLKTMIMSGNLKSDSLLWKQGMQSWEKAGNINSLQGLFPPEIPK